MAVSTGIIKTNHSSFHISVKERVGSKCCYAGSLRFTDFSCLFFGSNLIFLILLEPFADANVECFVLWCETSYLSGSLVEGNEQLTCLWILLHIFLQLSPFNHTFLLIMGR